MSLPLYSSRHWFLAGIATLILGLGAASADRPALAGVTSLTMQSDPGDYIGGGQNYSYSPGDGPFSASKNFDEGVSISFNTPSFDHFWYLDFAAPGRVPLTVGHYAGAIRWPFQDDKAGLSVAGDGRGCNTLTGSFDVLQVVYGKGDEIRHFWATFEQHCEGASPAIRGDIRFNADTAVPAGSSSWGRVKALYR